MAKKFLVALNTETIFSPTDENGHELDEERVKIALTAIITKQEYIWLLRRTSNGMLNIQVPHRIKPKPQKEHSDIIQLEDYEFGERKPGRPAI